MANGTEMSFWSHLDVLRGVLFRITAVILLLGTGAFIVMPWLFDNVILAPCSDSFPLYRLFDKISGAGIFAPESTGPFSLHLVSIELTSQFFTHLSAACWLAVVTGFPIIIYLLWGFVSPALYDHERHGLRRAFFMGNVMFYLGVATGYFLVFPLSVRFLAGYQLSPLIPNMISLDSYMDNFFTIMLVMGLVFELPLLAWMLGKMGILTRGFFNRYRRHAIVALLIVAAVITPTGDPFTLLVVFIPIYALWELSSRIVPAAQPQ